MVACSIIILYFKLTTKNRISLYLSKAKQITDTINYMKPESWFLCTTKVNQKQQFHLTQWTVCFQACQFCIATCTNLQIIHQKTKIIKINIVNGVDFYTHWKEQKTYHIPGSWHYLEHFVTSTCNFIISPLGSWLF